LLEFFALLICYTKRVTGPEPGEINWSSLHPAGLPPGLRWYDLIVNQLLRWRKCWAGDSHWDCTRNFLDVETRD
jgi:hypothetical protein